VSDDLPAVPEQPERSPELAHVDFLYRLAQRTTHSEMVPKALRGRPDAALAVMVYGHELGLRPMTALREVFIIEGTPSCSAKLMRALIYRNGHALHFVETSSQRCIVEGKRADGLGSARVVWEIADAQRAGLLTKDVWKKYPSDMLVARATSRLARLIFADCTVGYTPEELSRFDLRPAYDADPLEAGSTSAASLDYIDVGVDIDEPDDDGRPAYVIAAEMLDAEDALDAEWLAEARQAELDAEGGDP
jgi:hypothetical protein